ncbi:MAG: hypothetical protein ACUVTN_11955 [Thermodesulfobacteriota bacterium]
MSENLNERYGPYSKKKEKRRVPKNEGKFLKRTYEWLKWRIERIGGISIYSPCLEH